MVGAVERAEGELCTQAARCRQQFQAHQPHAPRGRHAISEWTVERRLDGAALVRVRILTGRTHQIRVHMAHRHYPLIGDPLYGGRPRIPRGASDLLIDTLRHFPRQALHARLLGFEHPSRPGERLVFEAPLPEDMGDAARMPADQEALSKLCDYLQFGAMTRRRFRELPTP